MSRYGKHVAVGAAVVATAAVGSITYSFQSSYQHPAIFARSFGFCDPVSNKNAKGQLELSPSQKAQFEREGYLVVKNVIPAEYIDCIREQADNYSENYKGVQKWFTQFSGRSAIHGSSHHAGWSRTFVTSHLSEFGIPSLASQLLTPLLTNQSSPSQSSNQSSNQSSTDKLSSADKSTNESSAIKLRLALDTLDIIPKDSVSAKTAPFRKDKNVHTPGLRIWIPFDTITQDSAPTVIVPRSHHWKRDCQTGHFEAGKMPLCPGFKQIMDERAYWKPVVVSGMKKGDILLIDTRVLHGWAPNRQIAPHRLALRLTIKPDASNFYQPIKFHDLGPMDVVAPQIWPDTVENHATLSKHVQEGDWPVPEPSFRELAVFSLLMLVSAVKHRCGPPSEPFRPYGQPSSNAKYETYETEQGILQREL